MRLLCLTVLLMGPVSFASTGNSPLRFEPASGEAQFVAHGAGHALYLTRGDAAVMETGIVVRMKLLGANPAPVAKPEQPFAARSNYYIGNNPKQWRTNVLAYARVRYQNVYPGIDLVYYGDQQQMEYDFIIAPGADPNRIQLEFSGVEKLSLDPRGNLVLRNSAKDIVLQRPFVYQDTGEGRRKIASRYIVARRRVALEVAAYDRSKPLIIDPVLTYSSYLGGTGGAAGESIAVDSSGNIYITGSVTSTNFPTASAMQPFFFGSNDVFLTKLDPTGANLIYSTYLGSRGDDRGLSVAVDSVGNAYVTGQTTSADFPMIDAFQPVYGGGSLAGGGDAFIAKFDPAGTLVYSTFLGGSDDDFGRSIALDRAGNIYVAGSTASTNFPTMNPWQPVFGGGTRDAFVAKLDATGRNLIYSTYLGGIGVDEGNSIAVDPNGDMYVAGSTTSNNFPSANAFQPELNRTGCTVCTDAYVVRLNEAGLVYSTYLGGNAVDEATGIAVDASGSAYVTGSTTSSNFPRNNPIQNTFGKVRDAFVTKLDPAGSALIYSTYLGGVNEDRGQAIVVDADGNAYVAGFTQSPNFPVESAFQPVIAPGAVCNKLPCADLFIAKLNADGSALLYSTYLGGGNADFPRGIALDNFGNAYVTGNTVSKDFPTLNPLQDVNTGGGSPVALVAKVSQ